jgi:hypothetical protein
MVFRFWEIHRPGIGARSRHLGNSATLLFHSQKGFYGASAINATVDAGIETPKEIFLQGVGLEDSWGDCGNASAGAAARRVDKYRWLKTITTCANPASREEEQLIIQLVAGLDESSGPIVRGWPPGNMR